MEIHIYGAMLAKRQTGKLSPPATPYTAYTDVSVPDREHKFVRDNMILELTAEDFLDADVSTGLWEEMDKQKPPQKTCTPVPEVSDEEESLASSVDTSGDDAEPEHLADIHRIETCKLATGKSRQAWVHVVDPADDGFGARWTLGCNINLWRSSATCGDLQSMKKTGKLFCPMRTALLPPHVTQSIKNATRQKKGKV